MKKLGRQPSTPAALCQVAYVPPGRTCKARSSRLLTRHLAEHASRGNCPPLWNPLLLLGSRSAGGMHMATRTDGAHAADVCQAAGGGAGQARGAAAVKLFVRPSAWRANTSGWIPPNDCPAAQLRRTTNDCRVVHSTLARDTCPGWPGPCFAQPFVSLALSIYAQPRLPTHAHTTYTRQPNDIFSCAPSLVRVLLLHLARAPRASAINHPAQPFFDSARARQPQECPS